MTPDHEINGRYFADAEVQHHITKFINCKNIYIKDTGVDQSLPLGRCFVELIKMGYSNDKEGFYYEIKLDQSGKAVVLTELPELSDKTKAAVEGLRDMLKGDLLSDDELADKMISRTNFGIVFAPMSDTNRNALISMMQEYHRVKSEGLFTKEDMIDFAKSCWNEPHSYEDAFNQWLESKKK